MPDTGSGIAATTTPSSFSSPLFTEEEEGRAEEKWSLGQSWAGGRRGRRRRKLQWLFKGGEEETEVGIGWWCMEEEEEGSHSWNSFAEGGKGMVGVWEGEKGW